MSSLSEEALKDLKPALGLLRRVESFTVSEQSARWKVWGNEAEGGGYICSVLSERMANVMVLALETLRGGTDLAVQLRSTKSGLVTTLEVLGKHKADADKLRGRLAESGDLVRKLNRELTDAVRLHREALTRVETVTHERDRAREECGYEKAMRRSINQELEWSMEARRKLESQMKGDTDEEK